MSPEAAFPVVRDVDRVRRLVALPDVKPALLEKLARATVAMVGMGGLGCGSAPYLAAAGVGRLLLIDPGRVAASDVGRQVLYGPQDVGRLKVEVAAERLAQQSPELAISCEPVVLGAENAAALLAGATVVLDGLDDGRARDVLNAWAVRGEQAAPVIFGGALGYEGQVTVVPPGGRPCLACLFGSVADAPAECSVAGVLGPLVGLVGALQAAEALKWILGVGQTLSGRLWLMDLFSGASRVVPMPRRAACPVCGAGGG